MTSSIFATAAYARLPSPPSSFPLSCDRRRLAWATPFSMSTATHRHRVGVDFTLSQDAGVSETTWMISPPSCREVFGASFFSLFFIGGAGLVELFRILNVGLDFSERVGFFLFLSTWVALVDHSWETTTTGVGGFLVLGKDFQL